MSRETASRFRITFAKTEHMRYTSHLDLQRTWERLMRRAGLPLLFSAGFHPRVRFNLAAALPLGFVGEGEICELYLTEHVEPEALLEKLRRSAPPGVRPQAVVEVPSLGPAVQTIVMSADYEIELPGAASDAIADHVGELLAARALPSERRGKPYDLRPLVESLELVRHGERTILRTRLMSRPGATGRPDELLKALGVDPLTARVCRKRLVLTGDSPEKSGERVASVEDVLPTT